jgi:hypothetical protein
MSRQATAPSVTKQQGGWAKMGALIQVPAADRPTESRVPPYTLPSDEEVTRARADTAFRRELLASNLQSLITAMAVMKGSPETVNPALAGQLREGADLAVQLADILKRMAVEAGDYVPPAANNLARSGK